MQFPFTIASKISSNDYDNYVIYQLIKNRFILYILYLYKKTISLRNYDKNIILLQKLRINIIYYIRNLPFICLIQQVMIMMIMMNRLYIRIYYEYIFTLKEINRTLKIASILYANEKKLEFN